MKLDHNSRPYFRCLFILMSTGLLMLLTQPATAKDWEMDADNSSLTFSARQQKADFEGEFQRFTAAIQFDPAIPESGQIQAAIDLVSVETYNDERDEYLVLPEWLDVPQWPQSIYEATSIRPADAKNSEHSWIADGTLTLKGVSLPVALAFNFTEDTDGASLTGHAELNRLAFGVGTGGWTDTRWVGDKVKISVNLRLK